MLHANFRCTELKGVYERWIGKKLTSDDAKLDLKSVFLEYLQLLVQQNRLLSARRICDDFLAKHKLFGNESILGHHTPDFIIIYEDILRREMNEMLKKLSPDAAAKLDAQRDVNGPQTFIDALSDDHESAEHKASEPDTGDDDAEQTLTFEDLPDKIWGIRSRIDSLYAETVRVCPESVSIHIAYALCLWRIGYTAEGIDCKTSGWTAYNGDIERESKYWMARGNAFINEDQRKRAIAELQRALALCIESGDKSDEVDTRLLLAVIYNKMGRFDEGLKECAAILEMDGNAEHEGALKMTAAMFQRKRQFKRSKGIYDRLLRRKEMRSNVPLLTEYISLLIEMRDWKEAMEQLQCALSLRPENRVDLMFYLGAVCAATKELERAKGIYTQILAVQPQSGRAYDRLIALCKDELAAISKDDGSGQKRKGIMAEYEKWSALWIENEPLNERSYISLIECLLLMDEWKRIEQVWTQWIERLSADRESENDCDRRKRIESVMSALYQHYGRICTQKHWNDRKEDDGDDEKGGDSEFDADGVIKGYFVKSLEFDGLNVAAFQGLAAYHITKQQLVEALSVLKRAKEAVPSVADVWCQYAILCQDVLAKNGPDGQSVGGQSVPHCVEVLKEGMECIANSEYGDDQKRVLNLVKMAQTLVEKLVLFQGADPMNRELAAKHCWLILDELQPLNVSALRNIGKVDDDRNRITLFFESLLAEHPTYCPALIEYAQFLTTAKADRAAMLRKAEGLLVEAVEITKSDPIDPKQRCVALYLLGFVKMHQMERGKGPKDGINERLHREAKEHFVAAVEADGENLYGRINLAQFLAFKEGLNEEALVHLEYAHRSLGDDEPNLIANLVKVLARKAIEGVLAVENEEDLKPEDVDKIDVETLERAFKLCGDGLRRFQGHFGLIVARSSLQNIKRKFGLNQLDDGLNDEEIEKLKNPQTTYGMVGVDIMNQQDFMGKHSKSDDGDE